MEQVFKDLMTLTGLSKEDFLILQETAPTTQEWVEDFVEVFYDTLYGYDPTAEVFEEGERPAREETLRQWYLEITSGEAGEDFPWRQWIVGLVHIPRHISNHYMLGMMSRVQQLFLQKSIQAFETAKAVRVYQAFKRVTDVVAGLIAEGYYRNYVSAMEEVAGIKESVIKRMMNLEIEKVIEETRTKIGE